MYVATVLTDVSFLTKFQVATLNKSSVSTWYKCLNRSLIGSRMHIHVHTYTYTYGRTYIHIPVPTYGKPKTYMYMPLTSCQWRGYKLISVYDNDLRQNQVDF